jgi:2-oxoglutarate dehydrogenase E1 component
LLRRQALQDAVKPLIVMTPKSLLRLPAASSTMGELQTGGFQPVIDDAGVAADAAVKRVVLCSGKVYYDLQAAREESGKRDVAVVRLEQFYPFPATAVQEIFARYPGATEIVWCQEEPKNMGAWSFVESRLRKILPEKADLRYIGRDASASPATGSYAIHNLEQLRLVSDTLTVGAGFGDDAESTVPAAA